MSKHLKAWTKMGTTFGMDVDGIRAARVLKKARHITRVNRWGTTIVELAIDAPQVASLMGEAAWLVTELQDFTHIQIDDSPKYLVIYPEVQS